MKKVLVVLSSLLLLSVGCGMKQDPMEGKPDAVRNGHPPSEKVETQEPEQSDVIRIDTVNKYTFVEGREDKISILARVLAPDFETQIQIVNIADFPGANYDQVSGEFSWAPPKGFVFDGLKKVLELNIRVFSKSTKLVQQRLFTKDRTVEVAVERSMGAPVIVKVEGFPANVTESESYNFTILVRDEDAGPVQDSFPRLVFSGPNYGALSLAPFIKIIRVDPDFLKREFLYSLSVDLRSSNLTDGYASTGFSVKAISRYNVISANTNIDSYILASFGAPKTSWTNEIKIQAGTEFNYSFVVYEPTGRADFETYEIDIPDGAIVACDTNSSRGVMPCTLRWDVPANYPLITSTMRLRVKAHKKYNSDVKATESEFAFAYQITPAPVVVTPVTPVPRVNQVATIKSKRMMQ